MMMMLMMMMMMMMMLMMIMMMMIIITLYVSMSLDPVEMMGSGRVFPQSLANRGDLCQ